MLRVGLDATTFSCVHTQTPTTTPNLLRPGAGDKLAAHPRPLPSLGRYADQRDALRGGWRVGAGLHAAPALLPIPHHQPQGWLRCTWVGGRVTGAECGRAWAVSGEASGRAAGWVVVQALISNHLSLIQIIRSFSDFFRRRRERRSSSIFFPSSTPLS